MGDKADNVEESAKKAQQLKQKKYREEEIDRNFRASAWWGDYYRVKQATVTNRKISFVRVSDQVDDTLSDATISTRDKTSLKDGVYEVKIDEQTQGYKIHVSNGQVKPIPPSVEGWSAAMDLLAQDGRSKAIVLYVSANPHFPDKAADNLLMWAQMCIDKGLAAELSEDAETFLRSTAVSPEKKQAIQDLVAISNVKLAESIVKSANEPKTSWLENYKKILDKQEAESAERINAIEASADNKAPRIAAEWKEFQDGLESLNAADKYLMEVVNAERTILDHPELLAKAENVNYKMDEKHSEKEIGERVLKNLGKYVTPEQFDKAMASIKPDTDDPMIQNRTRLSEAVEHERMRLRNKREELAVLLKNPHYQDGVKDQIKEFEALNTKMDATLGKVNDINTGELFKNKDAFVAWNVNRNAYIEKARNKQPPPPTESRIPFLK